MPNRILREGIIESRAVNSLSDEAELFYRRLMSVVDDYGRLEVDLEILRTRVFPRQLDRWPPSRVRQALTDVSEARSDDGQPLVTLYTAGEKAKKYLQINNFNQRTRSESKYPGPENGTIDGVPPSDDGHVTVTCQTSAHVARATSPSPSPSVSLPGGAGGDVKSNGGATPPIPPPAPSISTSEYPEVAAVITSRDPAVDEPFVRRVVKAAIQACISADVPVPGDEAIAEAVQESYDTYTGRTRHGPGLLLTRVPQILRNWAKNGRTESVYVHDDEWMRKHEELYGKTGN